MTKEFFFNNNSVYSSSAPGRMDVLGGVADYSGSLLLQMPIQQRTEITIQKRSDQILRIFSKEAEEHGLQALVEIDLEKVTLAPDLTDYAQVRLSMEITPQNNWTLYVAGCFVLAIQYGHMSKQGANVYVESEVPFAKGVSSSAAIEVATLHVMEKAFDFNLGELELPILAQKVENLVVGAPCGLMDQLSSYLGDNGKLLPLVCQPATVMAPIAFPESFHFVGIDSDVKHSVAGNAYGDVRSAAFMGYSIIAQSEGASTDELEAARNSGDWSSLPFGGYLANIPADYFKDKLETLLPKELSGKEFLDKYALTIDTMTVVDPNTTYKIRACATHPVLENQRIHRFLELLEEYDGNVPESALLEMGHIITAAHLSYSACGLGNEATDEIVDMALNAGPEQGIYGAKITGGGSGGTVCVMAVGNKGLETARTIHDTYQTKLGREVVFFEGSSRGASNTVVELKTKN